MEIVCIIGVVIPLFNIIYSAVKGCKLDLAILFLIISIITLGIFFYYFLIYGIITEIYDKYSKNNCKI